MNTINFLPVEELPPITSAPGPILDDESILGLDFVELYLPNKKIIEIPDTKGIASTAFKQQKDDEQSVLERCLSILMIQISEQEETIEAQTMIIQHNMDNLKQQAPSMSNDAYDKFKRQCSRKKQDIAMEQQVFEKLIQQKEEQFTKQMNEFRIAKQRRIYATNDKIHELRGKINHAKMKNHLLVIRNEISGQLVEKSHKLILEKVEKLRKKYEDNDISQVDTPSIRSVIQQFIPYKLPTRCLDRILSFIEIREQESFVSHNQMILLMQIELNSVLIEQEFLDLASSLKYGESIINESVWTYFKESISDLIMSLSISFKDPLLTQKIDASSKIWNITLESDTYTKTDIPVIINTIIRKYIHHTEKKELYGEYQTTNEQIDLFIPSSNAFYIFVQGNVALRFAFVTGFHTDCYFRFLDLDERNTREIIQSNKFLSSEFEIYSKLDIRTAEKIHGTFNLIIHNFSHNTVTSFDVYKEFILLVNGETIGWNDENNEMYGTPVLPWTLRSAKNHHNVLRDIITT